jgi:site-specific recombinase XerD
MISTARVSPRDWSAGVIKHDQAACQGFTTRQSATHTSPTEPIGYIIETWLLENYAQASNESTAAIYRKILNSLRSYLLAQGLDLDGPTNQLTQLIQTWASLRAPTSKHKGNVAPATYNQRIAAVNSFYSWVNKQQIAPWSNPTRMLSRSTIHKYAEAQALDVKQVSKRLKQIDRSTPRGQRDYVLLQVALNTGRSASELASLTWRSVDIQSENVTLMFEGGRRNKVMYDTLDSRLSLALLDYLHTIYGQDLSMLSPEVPIWISFSDRTHRQAIGPQTIADICETHLGVSKVQRLRHTFALTMDQVGAPMSMVQTKLGHENQSTTNAYLAILKKAHNPYASVLADAFGVETTRVKN